MVPDGCRVGALRVMCRMLDLQSSMLGPGLCPLHRLLLADVHVGPSASQVYFYPCHVFHKSSEELWFSPR